MTPKRLRGRPPKPAAERASAHLHQRITHAQRRAYERAARAEGLPTSRWVTTHLDRAAANAAGDQRVAKYTKTWKQ